MGLTTVQRDCAACDKVDLCISQNKRSQRQQVTVCGHQTLCERCSPVFTVAYSLFTCYAHDACTLQLCYTGYYYYVDVPSLPGITCITVVLQCYRRQAIPMEQAKIRPSVTLYFLDRLLSNSV